MTRILRRLHTSFNATRQTGETDRQLLERFRTSYDHDAFAALVERHGRTVLAACRRVLSDPADVDDAFQATFLVLFRKARDLAREESIGRWLYAVAHRVAVHARSDAARRRNREANAGRQRLANATAPDLSWREACVVLHEELDRLPDRFRLPLLLCYLQGQSRDEAAKSLGWTVGTVKGRLERGRRELASRLARRGIGLSAGLLAATAGTSVKGAGLPGDRIGRTVRAVVGGASPSVRTLARGALPATFAVPRAVASALLLTALLALGTSWFATTGVAREEPAVADKAAAPAAAEKSGPPANPPETRTVSGRVLDPDGKPVAGAKLFVPVFRSAMPVSPDEVDLRTAATTGADGRFNAAVAQIAPNIPRAYVIAYAPGFGVNWVEFADTGAVKAAGELTLRLTRDVPITGRVINTEGRPVPGVSVSVSTVYVPADDKLDDYLAAWKRDIRDALSTPKQRLYVSLSRITGPTTTDRDGRFTLRGAGAERIVHVLLDGGGVARAVPYVITRPGFDPKPYNDLLLRKEYDNLRVLNRFLGLHAPDFTFIAEPGRQLTGIVTDTVTGKPVAGCRVFAFTGYGDGPLAITDARGRYRLDSVPKLRDGYRVSIMPPPGSDYLSPQAPSSPDTEGYSPVRLDAKMMKGSVVTGRVVDKQTGKGVTASIRFVPLPDNKFFGTRPEYNRYSFDRTMENTDAEGRFRLVTIPGPALMMVQVNGNEKLSGQYLNPYRRATPDPARKELFHWDGDNWRVVAAGNSLEFLNSENTVKVIDVKETGETAVELFANRGATAKLMVQDADGRPLAGAWVAGLTDHWPVTYRLAEPSATVYALDPERARTLFLYHPERHLGGSVTVPGDAKEPVVVKLSPLARMSGRLLDVDGQPLKGVTASVSPLGQVASELYRIAAPGGPPVAADKDGHFTLVDVLPGVSFRLQYRKGEAYYRDKEREKTFTLKPGETRDVGDRTLEAQ